jgi:TrmH family RNA methyltransferase
MGSAFRVDVQYCDLPQTLAAAQKIGLPVYGTLLDGDNIYTASLSNKGVVVLGNEGHGILPETTAQITRRLLIPCGASANDAPESLNVATATAIVCSEFFRQSTWNH